MKKIFLIIISAILMTVLVSCKDTKKEKVTESISNTIAPIDEEDQNNNKSSHTMPAPQPITFDNIESSIAFINKPDYNKYPKAFTVAYQSMIESFKKDDYLTIVTSSVAPRLDATVTLYPEVKYEDVGVRYWFEFNKQKYEVIVYNTKNGEEYLMDLSKESIEDYYKKRFNMTSQNDIITDTLHSLFRSIIIKKTPYKLTTHCMIDDTHYIVIRTEADKSLLVKFIESLSIDRMEL